MPRDLPLGNGTLLLNFDSTYQLRDFYYPHVGKENHSTGGPFRFGVWTENNFRWITDDKWSRSLDYEKDTLVTRIPISRCGSCATTPSIFTRTCTSAAST